MECKKMESKIIDWKGWVSKGIDSNGMEDRKSTRLNSSHLVISYAVFCLKKKKIVRHVRAAQHVLAGLEASYPVSNEAAARGVSDVVRRVFFMGTTALPGSWHTMCHAPL